MKISVIAVAAVAAALLLSAAPRAAQEGAPPPTRDTTELVFEREVFVYPQYQRRDPFGELASDAGGGPRFEELVLLGIIHSPKPDLSVALLATGVEFTEGGVQIEQGVGGVDVRGEEQGEEQGEEAAGQRAPQQQEAQGPRDIQGTGYETYRVRAGDVLGNTRILEIQRMRVIVEVEEFGLVERREIRLRQPGDRGGQP